MQTLIVSVTQILLLKLKHALTHKNLSMDNKIALFFNEFL